MNRSLTHGLVIAVACLVPTSTRADDKLVGTKPPAWQVGDWINSKPLTLKALRGNVVLVRWWTAGGCPFCAATAPALNEFHDKYKDQGLMVIGMYHHKDSTPLDLAEVKRAVEKFGFKFPIAVDRDWRTLRGWWLNSRERGWTSVTFLLDRQGTIRHIHPGGKYEKGDKAFAAMQGKIEELLKEK